MKAETKAVLNVAKIIGAAIAGSTIAMLVLTYIPLNYIAIGFTLITLVLMVNLIYKIELDKLKYKEILEEMVKK